MAPNAFSGATLFSCQTTTSSTAMKPTATSTPSHSGGAVGRSTSARKRRYSVCHCGVVVAVTG